MCSVTGTPDGPGRVGISVCDITAGVNGFAAVLQALIERERTGKGQRLEVSLFSAASELMAVPYLQQRYTGAAPQRAGLAHPSIAPYGAFGTSDGQQVLISIQSEREWLVLCEKVLRRPEVAVDERFSDMSRRVANRAACDAVVAEAFGELDAAALTGTLLQAGIAFGEVNDTKGLVDHPQISTVDYGLPSGATATCVAPPVTFDGNCSPSFAPVPAVGQHTDAIRAEFARPP